MILIYIIIASLSGSEVKVNQSIPFVHMHECKQFISENQSNMLSSASRAYGKVTITEMGCVDMYNPVLEPHIKFKTM